MFGTIPGPGMLKPYKMNPCIEPRRGRFVEDAHGRLYDADFRERLRSAAVDDARRQVVEALGAIRTAAHDLRLSMERMAELHGLTEGRLQIIVVLKARAGHEAPLGELAATLGVTPRNVTGLVDHLERDGYVARVPDPDDRRSVLARLTDKGMDKVVEIWNPAVTRQLPAVLGLSPDELETLRHLCLRIVTNLRLPGAPLAPETEARSAATTEEVKAR